MFSYLDDSISERHNKNHKVRYMMMTKISHRVNAVKNEYCSRQRVKRLARVYLARCGKIWHMTHQICLLIGQISVLFFTLLVKNHSRVVFEVEGKKSTHIVEVFSLSAFIINFARGLECNGT